MQQDDGPTDRQKRQRSVMASDSEWSRIAERAGAAGMSISAFICQRAAGVGRMPPAGPALHALAGRLDGIETAVLTLAEIERQRLAERGEEDGWEAALKRVRLRLRAGRPLTGDPEVE